MNICKYGSWCTAIVILISQFLSHPLFASEVNGIVTKVQGDIVFDVGTLHVLLNPKARCETEDIEYEIVLKHRMTNGIVPQFYLILGTHAVPASAKPINCSDTKLRFGTRVRLDGEKKVGGEFAADDLTVYAVRLTKILRQIVSQEDFEGEAVVEEQPAVQRIGAHGSGSMWLDGYPFQVDSGTKLLRVPNGSKVRYELPLFRHEQVRPELESSSSTAPIGDDLFRPNTVVQYRALCCRDEGLSATELQMWPAVQIADEMSQLRQLQEDVTPPGWNRGIPGRLKMPRGRAFRVIPDKYAQTWISKVGAELIPSAIKSLKAADPAKPRFQFLIVRGDEKEIEATALQENGVFFVRRPTLDGEVLALPDGCIVLSDVVLTRLTSRAELAALLSYGIAEVIQRRAYIRSLSLRRSAPGDSNPEFVLDVLQDEQSMRLALRQMYLAGYDIRSAPFAWAHAQSSRISNPIMDDGNSELPWYAAYAFDYINRYFKNLNGRNRVRGVEGYGMFLKNLRKTDPDAFVN
ncbi:MAG: hypothetical protein ACLGSD_08870 [Acidobacteriota bacterium]